MREFVHEPGRVQSFADPDLMQVWPTITKVFTDNQRVIEDALQNNAFEREKMATHYQPQDTHELTKPKLIDSAKPIRILWASRISHQKRPDLLKQIADKLGAGYVVDAYGIIEKKQYSESFFNNSRVNYKGAFNGISSLPTDNYDIYLYTSQTDGVPNILMEVAAAGLPIVASNIGGVSEFVKHDKSGKLVDMEDIAGYESAIKSLVENPQQAQKLVDKSQQLLHSQHSWETLNRQVKSDID
jgi:glycosyltransferase involved in cell wall biosynthesis